MKTIGEFYREKILTRNDLTSIELPDDYDEVKVERTLFGWLLCAGKNNIECRSEEEARYLKIFYESGMKEVKEPLDDDFLKSILPELEKIKTRIDQIINSYLESILSPKIKENLKQEVWAEIIK